MKGAIAQEVLFSYLSFESRSLPVSKPCAILKQPLGSSWKLFHRTAQSWADALEGCQWSARLPVQSTSPGGLFLLPQDTEWSGFAPLPIYLLKLVMRQTSEVVELPVSCACPEGCPGEGVSIPLFGRLAHAPVLFCFGL